MESVVERYQYSARVGHRVVQHHVLHAVFGEHRDPGAGFGPRLDLGGASVDPGEQLRERHRLVLGDDRRRVRRAARRLGQQVAKQHPLILALATGTKRVGSTRLGACATNSASQPAPGAATVGRDLDDVYATREPEIAMAETR